VFPLGYNSKFIIEWKWKWQWEVGVGKWARPRDKLASCGNKYDFQVECNFN